MDWEKNKLQVYKIWYKIIVNVLIKIKNNEINLKIQKPNNIKYIEKLFSDILLNEIKENIDVIKLLEAIQFFAMTPAHNDNTNRQIAQICIGISHFIDVIGER